MNQPAAMAMCRVCTAHEPLLVPFSDRCSIGAFEDLPQAIGAIGGVPVEHNDGLPQHCCVGCLRQVEAALRVRQMCRESDRKLREMFAVKVKQEEDEQEGELEFMVELGEIKVEKADEAEEPEMQQDESNEDEEELFEVMQIVNEEEIEDEHVGGFKCGGCTQTYESFEKLVQHVSELGTNLSAEELKVGVQCKVYLSTVKYSFRKNSDLKDNFGCSLKCKSPKELLKSSQKVYFPERPHSYKKLFKCSICNEGFPSRKEYFAHKSQHRTKQAKFVCTKCGRRFYSCDELTKHQQLHGAGLLKCNMCPYIVVNTTDLHQHMQSHISSNGTYECLICKEFFISSSELSYHSRSHSAPYTCPQCPLSFLSEQSLKTHTRRHIKRNFSTIRFKP